MAEYEPKHRGEPQWWSDQQVVTDHLYFGNVCSGFGGTAECNRYTGNGGRCKKSPGQHLRVLPRHRYSEDEVEGYALALSAEGPDAFPFGYYLYLARIHFGRDEKDEG